MFVLINGEIVKIWLDFLFLNVHSFCLLINTF